MWIGGTEMKKILALIALLALLAGCSAEAAPAMYIQPAELDEKEEAVAKLLGADTDQHLFDVVLDGTAKKVSVCIYELVDGKWALRSGGGGLAINDIEEDDTTLRMAFGFDDLRGKFRQAIQFGSGDYSAVSHAPAEEFEERNSALGRTIAFLSNRTEIVYEQEIPLAIQINTTKNEVRSYDPEYFFQPEEYEKFGYEHVYALTVTFSQEPLS